MQKYLLTILTLLLLNLSTQAQDKSGLKFIDAQTLSKSGQWPGSSGNYHRVQADERPKLTTAVQNLSLNSAGINITFQTNSKQIAAKWKVFKYKVGSGMTPIAINGLDLYGWNGKTWQYIAAAKPDVKDENMQVLIKNLNGEMRHYKIYLPLYNQLTNLEIGIDASAEIKPADSNYTDLKKVAVYGSSITQGSSASRPGMAYPSILARKLNIETINLGFSGNGKMEIEIADLLAKIPADVYILDCVPNTSPAQIKERSYPLVTKLRKLKPAIPIIMVESVFREFSHWDTNPSIKVAEQNAEWKATYDRLRKEKQKNIYYIQSSELMGDDHDATIDGTHLTDLGFMRIADRIQKTLKKLL